MGSISINIEKTKVLIFNKPAHGTRFVVYGRPLEQVKGHLQWKSYLYFLLHKYV